MSDEPVRSGPVRKGLPSDEELSSGNRSDEVLYVHSESEIAAAFNQYGRVLAVGHRTKPPMSRCADTKLLSLAPINGMIQYEPSEFTFTAHAGTRVADIADELRSRGQYLPFDPMLIRAGATLGGTVASGIAGPGRFRYGGVRDFCWEPACFVATGHGPMSAAKWSRTRQVLIFLSCWSEVSDDSD